jgi:hypothetical protein
MPPPSPRHAPAKGPVIVLAFRFSGARALESILSRQPGLTCTSGTGVIPMCAQAVTTWQQVEGSPAMSALAASSVRALAGSMITCILAAAGGTRWCEVVTAPASTAASFARLFPQAQFVCLHRSCDQAVLAATQVSRLGAGQHGSGRVRGGVSGQQRGRGHRLLALQHQRAAGLRSRALRPDPARPV